MQETQQLTTDGLSDAPDFSRDGTEVVFVSGRGGEVDETIGRTLLNLYVVDVESGTERKLLDGVRDRSPKWSPDGGWIAFYRRSILDDDEGGIFVIRPDGSGLTRLPIPESAERFEWAPSGEGLSYWVLTERIELEDEGALIQVPVQDGPEPTATLSPLRVPITRDIGDFRIIDPDGSNDRFLASGDSLVWSPSGEAFALIKQLSEDISDLELQVVARDGSFEQSLGTVNSRDVVWSPDDSRIAIQSDVDGNAAVNIIDVTSGDIEEVPGSRSRSSGPIAWTQQGLYFHKNIKGPGFDVRLWDGSNPPRSLVQLEKIRHAPVDVRPGC